MGGLDPKNTQAMEESTPSKGKSPVPPRISRVGIGANILVQIIALAVILLGVNYLSFEYYWRADFSRSQKFTLADQTRRVLRQMDDPIRIIVYFSKTALTPDAALYNDVSNLMKELQFSARKNMKVKHVDPARDFAKARDLQNKYKFGANENVVIVDYNGRSKIIPVAEMATWDEEVLMSGRGSAIKEFRGEQAMTTAFLELAEPDTRKIYFLQGHGESTFAEGGELGVLRDYVQRQSLAAEPLDLSKADAIPEDAGVVVIASPRYDLPPRVIQILKAFWEGKGSIFVALDPNFAVPNLSAFLTENGILPVDNRILRTLNLGFATGILRDVNASFVPGSPITKRLQGLNALFTGATQSLQMDTAIAEPRQIVLRPILEAAEGYWGETQYAPNSEKGVQFDAGVDAGPPLILAVAAEKGAVHDDRVELGGSKMIAIGNGIFLSDQALNQVNLDFFLSSINWMLDRSNVAGVAPKSIKQFQLHLTDRDISRIALYTLLVIPGIAAAFGLVVWLRRRS